jgi:hypothetical protein
MWGTSAATVAARRRDVTLTRLPHSRLAEILKSAATALPRIPATRVCYAGLLRSRTGPDVGVRVFADMRPTPVACYGRPRILKARDRPAALIDPLPTIANGRFGRLINFQDYSLKSLLANENPLASTLLLFGRRFRIGVPKPKLEQLNAIPNRSE